MKVEFSHSLRSTVSTLAALILFSLSVADGEATKTSETLRNRIDRADVSTLNAIVFLNTDQAISPFMKSSIARMPRFADRYRSVYSELVRKSSETRKSLLGEISRAAIDVDILKCYVTSNAILVRGKVVELGRLANLECVHYVVEDTVLELIEPVESSPSSPVTGGAESNLTAIKADKLWAMGYTGEGRLVMSFDTGVDGAHSGLASRWRGLSSADPSSAWYDPFGTDFPTDNNGHGTHVMGIMAGVVDGDTVGVAPDAEWACAAVIDRGSGFSQTISDILSAFDWAANPDGDPETIDDVPDAINHSWGIPTGIFGPCDETFWQAIDNLEQLGVVNVFACGNEGPDPRTIRNPADRATSPLNSFSVGAVDHRTGDFQVAPFSSRGPANCDSTIMKPEVVAPGVSINSLKAGGGTRIMSGTSMASPHVVGAVALLRQFNPDATAEQIKHALIMSATDIEDPGEDNESGYGVINLERALDHMPIPTHATITYKGFEVSDENGNAVLEAGEAGDLIIEVEIRNSDVDGLWGVLGTYSDAVEILSDSAYFGVLTAGTTVRNDAQPFAIAANSTTPPGTKVTFRLDFYDSQSNFLNNSYFTFTVGQSQYAATTSIVNGPLAVGVSNFGAVGLGNGSIIGLGEAGFAVDSTDFLSEFALVIADAQGRVSDAARNSTGIASDNDFLADDGTELTVSDMGIYGAEEAAGSFSDGLAELPIGVRVNEHISMFADALLSTTVLVAYQIYPAETGFSGQLVAGIVSDVDFPGDVSVEEVAVSPSRDLTYYYNPANGDYIGIGMLNGPIFSLAFFSNPLDSNIGLSDSSKREAVWSGEIENPTDRPADHMSVMSSSPTEISADMPLDLAFVVIYAGSLDELETAYDRAYEIFNNPTAADDDDLPQTLPETFELSQNYPNPFNPTTRISFSVTRSQHVSIEVFNVLGERIAGLFDDVVSAGTHEVIWDGIDDFGSQVASGMYFYRLLSEEGQATRKMLLIK